MIFKYRKTFLFVFTIVFVLAYILAATRQSNVSVSPTQADAIIEKQDLSKLLMTDQTPKIVKCNFTGTYQVTQDFVHAKNGATCNDFEPRTIVYDNVISECSKYLDPNHDLFLSCTVDDNPVRKCDGVILINVSGTEACEYWVIIRKID